MIVRSAMIAVSAVACCLATTLPSLGADTGNHTAIPGPDTFAARVVLDDAVLEGCQVCHRDNLDLSDMSTDEVIEAINEFAQAGTGHPVPIPELSEADVRALAEALAGDSEP